MGSLVLRADERHRDSRECAEENARGAPPRLGYRGGVSRRAQQIVIAVVALALVVSVGAVGLSGLLGPAQDPQAARSEGASAPADTRAAVDPASQPRPSPTTAPERPAQMDQQTAEGAQAALRYMLEVYAYMMATGDTAAWTAGVDPTCQVCVQFIANAEQLHAQGGYGAGGEFTVTATSFEGSGEPPASGVATADFHQAAQVIVDDPTKEPLAEPEVTARIQARMAWDGEGWRVGDMTILQPTGAASDGGA